MSNSQFKMFACDYDGTIASHGVVSANTEQALIAAKQTGFLVTLITGREFEDLLSVCPQLHHLFDLVVAENGAVLYLPESREIENLASPPPTQFITELTRRGVPFSSGRVIASISRIYEDQVNSLIREFGLSLHVIYNKDAAMILPVGIDKATGLRAGVKRFSIDPSQVIGAGDAENDLDFLQLCGFKVAVANALDAVKADADWVAKQPNGDGIAEFVREYLKIDTVSGK